MKTPIEFINIPAPFQYCELRPVMELTRDNVSSARAKRIQLREVRVDGNIEFRIAGELVAVYKGSEGTQINSAFKNYLPYEMKIKFIGQEAGRCIKCQHYVTEVRPGKHQCDFCEMGL